MAEEPRTATEGNPLSGPNLRRPLAFAISCFLIWGLAYGLLDVLNKHFQETLHIDKAESSWLQVAYFGAYLSMSIPAGFLMSARGYKSTLLSGLTVTSLGALLFVPAAETASFSAFVGSMFVMATGLCFLETAADTYVNVLGPPERASQRLNLAQSFNALGVFFGPLIGGALFFSPAVTAKLGSEQRAVQMTYLVISVTVLIYTAVLSRVDLPEIRLKINESESDAAHSVRSLWRERHFVLGVATQGLYVGAQVGIGAYFINLVTETWRGLSSQEGAFLLSLAAVCYLAGRFATTALLLRIRPQVVLTTYGATNVLLCLIVTAGIQKLSAIALIAVFFFMGTMFPTIFTQGVKDLGPLTKRGASIMVMAIGGGIILPYPMGRIADLYGTPTAFFLPAAIFALVALYGWKSASLGARRAEVDRIPAS